MNIFKRYKGRLLLTVILKSLLAGIGASFLVGGVLLLLLKLEVIGNSVFPVLFGIISGVACLLILFLLLKGNDKRLARMLDSQLELKEKVQTMLVHKDSQGAIYELQRDDALSSLEKAKGKSIGLKGLWIYIVAFAIGVGMLITSLVINPVKPEPEPEPEIPFELTTMQEAALLELISYIDASEMQEPYKANVKTAVSDLITGLKISTTEKERNICLDSVLDKIYKETDDSSLALELISELWACNTDTSRALARSLNYYDWPLLDEWDKYADSIADFRSLFIYTAISDAEGEKTSEAEMIAYVKPLLSDTAVKLLSAITKSGIDKDDELSVILVRLANENDVNDKLGTKILGLTALSESIEALGYTETERALDDTMLAFNSIIFKALTQHKTNTDTGEYAMTRICGLFGYKLPAFERPRLIQSSVGEDGTEGEGGAGGGAIGGGPTFGSDDLVYDPNTGEYVEYGEILSRYYALMYGKVDAGVYTDEEKAALEKYFSILQDGFPEEKDEGESENE